MFCNIKGASVSYDQGMNHEGISDSGESEESFPNSDSLLNALKKNWAKEIDQNLRAFM